MELIKPERVFLLLKESLEAGHGELTLQRARTGQAGENL
jgi:hypothetical protein